MKKLLFVILSSLLSLFGFSQNGGQINENNVLKINYISYINGTHSYVLKNKLNCQVLTKLDKNNNFTEHMLQPLEELNISIPGNLSVNFKAKKIQGAECITAPDAGWVELPSPIVLPATFGQIIATKVNPALIRLTFESQEDMNLYNYNILVSRDGKTFKKIHVLFPNGVKGNQKYIILVKF